MNRITEILTIKSENEIPTLDTIRSIPRHKTLKLVFEPLIQDQREAIGARLKAALIGFQIGVHITQPEINIAKLVTDEEIEANHVFFEKCAKDYRELSTVLINQLADKLEIAIDPNFPLQTFNPLKRTSKAIGQVGDWRYYLHGFHCGFENTRTKQLIESPLVFGLEFGDLDPYFFSRFIKSTSEYQPLPVEIYEDYADGVRINEKMLQLGKFEKINSNIENHWGIAVADRDKIEVQVFRGESKKSKPKEKFNIWRYFGLR